MREYGPWWDSRFDGTNLDQYRRLPDHNTGYDHFIDLKFDHFVYLYTVYVYETFNPGAVTAIYAGSTLCLSIYTFNTYQDICYVNYEMI